MASWRLFSLAFLIVTLGAPCYSTSPCPEGWLVGSFVYCYKLVTSPLSWQLAAGQCETEGGELTSILTQQENNYLVASFAANTSLAWIGMDSNGDWIDERTSAFTNGFQTSALSATMCAVINLANGQWDVATCQDPQDFICKVLKDSGDVTRTYPPDVPPEEQPLPLAIGLVIGLVAFFFVMVAVACCIRKKYGNCVNFCSAWCPCCRPSSPRGAGQKAEPVSLDDVQTPINTSEKKEEV